MLKEFKEFALKGNIMDMAIGVIIGGAFGKIVTSLVNDLIMPAISLVTGKMDFTNLFVSLNGETYATLEEAKAAGAATLNYGNFITTIIDFLIIAFSIFLVINQLGKVKARYEKIEEIEEEATEKECPFCKTMINKDATRCPHCTSELTKESVEKE